MSKKVMKLNTSQTRMLVHNCIKKIVSESTITDPDLEAFRLNSVRELKSNTIELKLMAAAALPNAKIKSVAIIGSILSKNYFTSNSDVDVAFEVNILNHMSGLDEHLSMKVQQAAQYLPFSFGVVNTLVFVNTPIKTRSGLIAYI